MKMKMFVQTRDNLTNSIKSSSILCILYFLKHRVTTTETLLLYFSGKNCCMAVRFRNFFLLTLCRLDCVINTRYHQTWCSSVNMYKAPIFSTWMIIVLGSARFTTSTGGWLSLSCFSHRSPILTTAPELEHNKTAKWMPVTGLAEWLVLTHASQICIVTKLYLISFNKSPGSVLESQNSEQKNLSRIYCIL